MQALWDTIRDWQTLIAGTMAVLAAAWTIREIRRQVQLQAKAIKMQQAQHDEMQRRREVRAQVDLPDAVVEVMHFAEDCFRVIFSTDDDIPEAPAQAMDTIKRATEFAHPDRVQSFRDLVNLYQIQNSRMQAVDGNTGGRLYELDLLVGCLELRTLAERLLEYGLGGEGEWQHPACSYDEIYSALRQTVGLRHFVTNEATYEELIEHIKTRHHDADG